MQELIIVAGPNGSGKTTFANQFLPPEEGLVFVNADEIAYELSKSGVLQNQLNIRSARVMIDQINQLTAAGVEIMLETTLASLTYAQKIPFWQQCGYTVELIYLRLPSVELSVERVRRRVLAGGHDIPENVIKRRYSKSLQYFENYYKPIVDEWYLWESLDGSFELIEAWDD